MSKTSATPYFQTMSPVPPEPQPTNAPPSFATDNNEPEPTSTKPTTFPDPKLRLELRDLGHKSTGLFLKNFNAAKDFQDLVDTVLHQLYTVKGGEDASTTRPTPLHTKIPGTRSITLILRDVDGVAYTTGTDLDNDHKEIHLSLSYLEHVGKQNHSARTEILGVVCHELVHCFQWNGKGTCNGGLIEGIADWVRLNAGFIPPHWRKETTGEWDGGYQKTGYFLDWIERNKGKGSVYKINQALCDKRYEDDAFWKKLFGQSVEDLWDEYVDALKKPKDGLDQYGDPNKKMEIRIKSQGHASEETAEDDNDH